MTEFPITELLHWVRSYWILQRSNLLQDEMALAPTIKKEKLMEIGETIYVTTREEFREWLEKNHKTCKEIWLIQYKKFTQKPSIPYADAVEEAICFGWIDGFEKGMDEQRFAKRFTPRRQKSLWTDTNIERARKMLEEGKMTEAGRVTLPKGV